MSKPKSAAPQGVHLVGSASLPTTEAAFRYFSKTIPNHLHRMPDGETGVRDTFTRWQRDLFPEEAQASFGIAPKEDLSREAVKAVVAKFDPINTGYDDAAIASYAVFKELKQQGVIPAKTRFQVCLPTAVACIFSLKAPYRAEIEPVYTAALLRSLARIQAEIPAEDLAIQWDLALEFAILEGVSYTEPWFPPTLDAIMQRLGVLVEKVQEDVEMGFHLCYGDYGHQHFIEPKDTSLLVKVANEILEHVKHPVSWIHIPVPKNRDDLAYFAPLQGLKLPESTEFYLGLVHANDQEGTLRRIKAANDAGVVNFGVATECGMGRTPTEELDSIFEIFTTVSQPILI